MALLVPFDGVGEVGTETAANVGISVERAEWAFAIIGYALGGLAVARPKPLPANGLTSLPDIDPNRRNPNALNRWYRMSSEAEHYRSITVARNGFLLKRVVDCEYAQRLTLPTDGTPPQFHSSTYGHDQRTRPAESVLLTGVEAIAEDPQAATGLLDFEDITKRGFETSWRAYSRLVSVTH